MPVGDGQRVYFLTGNGLKKKLQTVGIHGEEPRDVFDLKYVDAVSLSPNGQWVAFIERLNACVAPLPQTGAAILSVSKFYFLPHFASHNIMFMDV